jgi:hypothetical protein
MVCGSFGKSPKKGGKLNGKRLKEILNKIISSKKEDWEKFRCEGGS